MPGVDRQLSWQSECYQCYLFIFFQSINRHGKVHDIQILGFNDFFLLPEKKKVCQDLGSTPKVFGRWANEPSQQIMLRNSPLWRPKHTRSQDTASQQYQQKTTWHSYFVGSKDISEATYITREISKHHFWCLVLYLSKIIWSPITSSGRFDVCLFRHILSLIPNSDHLFCRRYFLPIGRATVFSHMTDMLPKSHNIHPHTQTHFHDQSKTQIYPSEDTPEVKVQHFHCLSWRFWSQSLKLLNLPP